MLTLILLATGPILAAMAAYSLLSAIAGDDLDDAAE
jgi:hypothetical protein